MALRFEFRWVVCALLFFATAVNYLDRQVLSLTWKDFIAPEFGWTDSHYGVITGYFSLIYAACMLFAGRIVDWLGTKRGYLWAIGVWSAAACLHALCGKATSLFVGVASVASVSMWLFLGCRCLLALGEAGNFPAAIRATAEHFAPPDRAFATSFFNSGSSVGAILAPALIPPLAAAWGWEAAFLLIGALGFVWMGFWAFLYDDCIHGRTVAASSPPAQQPAGAARYNGRGATGAVTTDSLAGASRGGRDGTGVSYVKLFALRQTWALLLGRFLTDGVWWFFLFWTPGYLSDRFGYRSSSGTGMAMIVTLYALATVLSVVLCKLPSVFMARPGVRPYDGRLKAMFVFALIPLVALGAQPLGSVSAWWPVVLIGLACAGHMAWSANVFSAAGDLFPKRLVGTMTGIAGLACGLSSFFFNIGAGRLFTCGAARGDAFAFLGFTGKDAGYMIVFCICAVAYLLGWACMKALVPTERKVET